MGIRLTKIILNHIKDEHFLLLLGENIHGIHGGTDTVLSDRYIESCVGTQIFYLDAKTLYGWAMSQYLPKGEFEQLTLDELQQQIQLIIQPPQKQVWLFFWECYLEYPPKIKLVTENLPLCPYQTQPCKDYCFSEYMNSVNNYRPTTKLTFYLTDKTKFLTHYCKVKFYLEQRMKIT